MPGHFEERFEKYFPLMKEQFPDYEAFKEMEAEPQEPHVVLLFQSEEAILQEEKMKYHLAQGMKKMEEIYQLWQKKEEKSPEEFASELKKKHKEAKEHFKPYMDNVKTIGDHQNRVHIFEPLYSACIVDDWLAHEMLPLLNTKGSNEEAISPKYTKLEDAQAEAQIQRKNKAIKKMAPEEEKKSFFVSLYAKMKASYDTVMWNSTEYKAMFSALEPFKDGVPTDNLEQSLNKLHQATQNYISLKKDIPITENGKIRINLARELLDITELMRAGVAAEKQLGRGLPLDQEQVPIDINAFPSLSEVNLTSLNFNRPVTDINNQPINPSKKYDPIEEIHQEGMESTVFDMKNNYPSESKVFLTKTDSIPFGNMESAVFDMTNNYPPESEISLHKADRRKTSPYDEQINTLLSQLVLSESVNTKTNAFKTDTARLMILLVARKEYRDKGTTTIDMKSFPQGYEKPINDMKIKTDAYLEDPETSSKISTLLKDADKFHMDFLNFQNKPVSKENEVENEFSAFNDSPKQEKNNKTEQNKSFSLFE
ncbi:MAG: hypothetical protein Q4B50_05925 [Bacillota bacterium]|nr:hypothetical protein [Bacillota bacterium]